MMLSDLTRLLMSGCAKQWNITSSWMASHKAARVFSMASNTCHCFRIRLLQDQAVCWYRRRDCHVTNLSTSWSQLCVRKAAQGNKNVTCSLLWSWLQERPAAGFIAPVHPTWLCCNWTLDWSHSYRTHTSARLFGWMINTNCSLDFFDVPYMNPVSFSPATVPKGRDKNIQQMYKMF